MLLHVLKNPIGEIRDGPVVTTLVANRINPLVSTKGCYNFYAVRIAVLHK
jgi:hypothetical protein